jgi:nucleotide-binding universal stress UspA family protein
MYKKILVTTDGTKLSKKAIIHAMRLAQLSQAELLILKVIPVMIQTYFDEGIVLRQNEIERIEKSWQDDAHSVVDKFCSVAKKLHINATPIVYKSDVIYRGILDIADDNKVDLIVMSSHGRQGIKKFLLGSETQNVLVHTSIPVLILR